MTKQPTDEEIKQFADALGRTMLEISVAMDDFAKALSASASKINNLNLTFKNKVGNSIGEVNKDDQST